MSFNFSPSKNLSTKKYNKTVNEIENKFIKITSMKYIIKKSTHFINKDAINDGPIKANDILII